jgi:hypothetical protein
VPHIWRNAWVPHIWRNAWVPHIWRSFIAPDVGNHKLNPPFLIFPEYLIEKSQKSVTSHV